MQDNLEKREQRCISCGSCLGNNIVNSIEGNFYRCLICDAIILNEDQIPSNLKDYYSEDYYTSNYEGRNDLSVFNYRLNNIYKYVKYSGKVLEIGCGSGEFLSVLKELGYSTFGVELSSRAASVGRQKYGLSITGGDLMSVSYDDESFDAVLMYHVIEHLPNPSETLDEIYRILKPNGVLIIETPNSSSVDIRWSDEARKSVFDFPNHTILFNKRSISRIVKDSGFKILSLETSFSYVISKLLRPKSDRSPTNKSINKGRDEKRGNPTRTLGLLKSFMKKVLSKVLPGMKLTCIVLK